MDQSYFELLPIEVKEEIFQYISATDLLNLALVSKTLNQSIGFSRKCMNKFWIKFYSFNLKDLESLKLSVRKYEKLKVNRLRDDDHFNYLIELRQNWKKVLIYNCEFKSFSMFKLLVESFASKVEELEISDVEILTYDDNALNIYFPSLKRVMFRNVPLEVIKTFLSCEKLEIAAFDIAQATEQSGFLHDVIYQILKNSRNLKQLQLGPLYIKALFGEKEDNENLRFDFKLEKLLLKFPIASDLPNFSYSQISQFIKAQSPSINWFIAMELRNDEVMTTVWNDLKSADQISFIGLEELFDVDMEFNITVNTSITKLSLMSRKVLLSRLNKLLKSSPSLKYIHVRILNQHILKMIFEANLPIKIIFYEYIEEDAVELYNQLSIINNEINLNHNQNIKLVQQSFWFHENPFSLDPIFWRKD